MVSSYVANDLIPKSKNDDLSLAESIFLRDLFERRHDEEDLSLYQALLVLSEPLGSSAHTSHRFPEETIRWALSKITDVIFRFEQETLVLSIEGYQVRITPAKGAEGGSFDLKIVGERESFFDRLDYEQQLKNMFQIFHQFLKDPPYPVLLDEMSRSFIEEGVLPAEDAFSLLGLLLAEAGVDFLVSEFEIVNFTEANDEEGYAIYLGEKEILRHFAQRIVFMGYLVYENWNFGEFIQERFIQEHAEILEGAILDFYATLIDAIETTGPTPPNSILTLHQQLPAALVAAMVLGRLPLQDLDAISSVQPRPAESVPAVGDAAMLQEREVTVPIGGRMTISYFKEATILLGDSPLWIFSDPQEGLGFQPPQGEPRPFVNGMVFGRDSTKSQGVVFSVGVSRVHAQVWLRGNALTVEDLNSSNGTRVRFEASDDQIISENFDRLRQWLAEPQRLEQIQSDLRSFFAIDVDPGTGLFLNFWVGEVGAQQMSGQTIYVTVRGRENPLQRFTQSGVSHPEIIDGAIKRYNLDTGTTSVLHVADLGTPASDSSGNTPVVPPQGIDLGERSMVMSSVPVRRSETPAADPYLGAGTLELHPVQADQEGREGPFGSGLTDLGLNPDSVGPERSVEPPLRRDPPTKPAFRAGKLSDMPLIRKGGGSGDSALLGETPEGGVDWKKVNVAVEKEGQGVMTAFEDPAVLQQLLDSPGLGPVIYGIQPMTVPMLNMIFGRNTGDEDENQPSRQTTIAYDQTAFLRQDE